MFVLHKNEEKTEQNSASFRKPTSIERGLRPNGYFPLMRQPLKLETAQIINPNRRKKSVYEYEFCKNVGKTLDFFAYKTQTNANSL